MGQQEDKGKCAGACGCLLDWVVGLAKDSRIVSLPPSQHSKVIPYLLLLLRGSQTSLAYHPLFRKTKILSHCPQDLLLFPLHIPTHLHLIIPAAQGVIFPIPLWALLDSLLFVWESHLALCRAYSWFCTWLIPAKLKGSYRAQGKHLLYSPAPRAP